jgi:hypothetical protein
MASNGRVKATTAFAVIANCCPCESYDTGGERLEDADALFHQDPRWLGGGSPYSIDLGNERTLWLFGDSFIATSPALTRRESTVVPNSIAVMTGRDPRDAAIEFAWRDGSPPGPFFPGAGDHHFRPLHGIRLPDGPLVVFLAELAPEGPAGFRAVRIPNPDEPPAAWTIEPLATLPAPHDPSVAVGTCTAVEFARRADSEAEYTEHLVAFTGDGRAVRWPLVAVGAGLLTRAEWWTGDTYTLQDQLARDPAIVIPDPATECSLVTDFNAWYYLANRDATLATRWAYGLAGGFTEPENLFTPPEPSTRSAIAHPSLAGAGPEDYIITYTDDASPEELLDPAREATLYWPHFAHVRHRLDCD